MERTESRIFLLYCTKKEAKLILEQSSLIGLTGKNYIWIATQAVIGKYLKNDPLNTNSTACWPIGRYSHKRNSMSRHSSLSG
jgi:hypothetical protein